MSNNAPKGAMSSPFVGMGEALGNSGVFDVSGTTKIEKFTDEELNVLIPELAKIGKPLGKQAENRCFIVEIAGVVVKIFKNNDIT